MQVASITTTGPSLRAEIEAWTFEDSALFVDRVHESTAPRVHIGYTPSPKVPCYGTVLEMLANGWQMLAPPTQQESYTSSETGRLVPQWSWWLTRGAP